MKKINYTIIIKVIKKSKKLKNKIKINRKKEEGREKMKKILLGLFILGTLGMAQGNYKINVKNGVKFSQSEINQESKEIENIVNRDLFEKVNDAFQKKILVKVREFNKQYMDNLINESMKEVPRINERSSSKSETII